MEVLFLVESDVLRGFSPDLECNEAGMLEAFDGARGMIEAVADRVYSQYQKGTYTFILVPADFVGRRR
jgi:hypothetical protein